MGDADAITGPRRRGRGQRRVAACAPSRGPLSAHFGSALGGDEDEQSHSRQARSCLCAHTPEGIPCCPRSTQRAVRATAAAYPALWGLPRSRRCQCSQCIHDAGHTTSLRRTQNIKFLPVLDPAAPAPLVSPTSRCITATCRPSTDTLPVSPSL